MFGKKDDSLLCPFDKKACIKERCVGWQTGPTEQTVDGVKQTVLHSDCFIVWDLLYKKAIANRTDGTQAAAESLRNAVVAGNEQTLRILALRQTKLVGGNDEKDA